MQKVLFELSQRLWQVWGLILNAILPLLPSCWGFSFALGCGVSFYGRIHHSPVDGCSAVSCNFGVLAGEDEHRSFYSTILKPEQHSVVDVTCDGSKVPCYKEQYCIGTWNVRSTNQGKLEVVKQEMARVNIDILGISELRWTGMGEFNSDDHYIYYCGNASLRRNGVAIIVNKRV